MFIWFLMAILLLVLVVGGFVGGRRVQSTRSRSGGEPENRVSHQKAHHEKKKGRRNKAGARSN